VKEVHIGLISSNFMFDDIKPAYTKVPGINSLIGILPKGWWRPLSSQLAPYQCLQANLSLARPGCKWIQLRLHWWLLNALCRWCRKDFPTGYRDKDGIHCIS